MARILVVDDQEAVREVLSRRLSRLGHDVEAAGSASAALELLSARNFTIVFCDAILPDEDGLRLLEQISARWPRTAVVMLSGSEDSQRVKQAKQLGAVEYLTKPVDRDLFSKVLQDALEVWKRRSDPELL
jgi:DNA-binding NtrC family response regulator